MAAPLVAVPITAGVVVHMGDHAFREGDSLNLPAAHAAELQAHLAAAKLRHDGERARLAAAAAPAAPVGTPAAPSPPAATPPAAVVPPA